MSNENLGRLLFRRSNLSPQLESCVEPSRNLRLSFAELNSTANRFASLLRNLGVAQGDRIALLLPSGNEFVGLFYAAAKIGAVVVPLNLRLAGAELAYILEDSGARAVFYADLFAPLVTEIRACEDHELPVQHWIELGSQPATGDALSFSAMFRQASDAEPDTGPGGDTNLFIMYTSGTTGRPKGVVHTHESVLWSALTWLSVMDLRAGDRLWLPLPMFHVAALIPVVLAVQRGLTLVVTAEFNPAEAWQVIEKEKVTVAGAVPAMLNFMRQVPGFAAAELKHLRCFITGAAPMPVELIEIYAKRGIEVVQGYSLTETAGGGCFLANEFAASKAGSTGKAMLYTDVRVIDANGEDVAAGESGEVLFRGPHLMKEYWNNPKATKAAFTGGWLHTGDVATVDEDGFIYIKDRIKDMIISGGENVYPAEVENALLSFAGVVEAAVIGQPSEKWGESAFAVVVRKEDSVTEAALLEHCRARLSKFKLPKGFAFVETIPRNPSGKILKRELRAQFPGPAAD